MIKSSKNDFKVLFNIFNTNTAKCVFKIIFFANSHKNVHNNVKIYAKLIWFLNHICLCVSYHTQHKIIQDGPFGFWYNKLIEQLIAILWRHLYYLRLQIFTSFLLTALFTRRRTVFLSPIQLKRQRVIKKGVKSSTHSSLIEFYWAPAGSFLC